MASPFDQLSGASVLDTAHVIAFAGGDFALALDLLQDFLATLDFHMRLLDAALVADDWREDAHRLKAPPAASVQCASARLPPWRIRTA
ncbi:hypothetical protein E6W36_13140 [Hankyongella ginsenosidimutans]|uniref:Hpt domain-containing protein n=1 Tax=Hankyongella ginsenosidimutans TaxID=1763828 RepID=A0A4D7C7N4_9SPHN|nr:hypothetical protein [Hankyongella ginsenosidimutans]QCI80110.1 hypothetical protein E6W36_13140 [Hankyongella ginsenosidimutans]